MKLPTWCSIAAIAVLLLTASVDRGDDLKLLDERSGPVRAAVVVPVSAVLLQEKGLPAGSESVLLSQPIRALLEKSCLSCHNPQIKKGGLDLSSRNALLRGGDHGPAIVTGNAKASLLYKLAAHEQEPSMPFMAEKLPEEAIALIAKWIDTGAPYNESVTAAGSSRESVALTVSDPGVANFILHVRPVLEKECLPCHGGGDTKRSGFDLSTREGLLRGGDNGRTVVPGDAQSSALYKRVRHEIDPGMPFQGKKLPEDTIAKIAEWINAGVPYDRPLNANRSPRQSVAQAPEANGSGVELFIGQVRPALEENCLRCHGGGVIRSGLDLSTREGLLRGGSRGPVVVPGNAQASVLYKRIRHEIQPGMPFQGQTLPADVIAKIAEWINAGAPYDRPLKMSAADIHWAFKRPNRAPVPKVMHRSWVRNSIDAFVLAELEKRGLQPVPEADKRTLLRRVYLDLVGLPPTPEETRAFLADHSKDAYERVVDRLLADPRYGERWGRHWMDIWRYSDWYGSGSQVRNSQPHLWHWRDWIIESLNADKGYDRMILEMLAGDELAPGDPQMLRATGYLARDWYRFNRNVWLQETVEHTAAAFLGMTLKCARCHDHKYDPMPQEEYYRFRAFFEPYDVRLDRVPGQPELDEDGIPRVFDAAPREAIGAPTYLPAIFKDTYRFNRGNESDPDASKPLSPGVPAILNNGSSELKIEPDHLPVADYYPDLRDFVEPDLIGQAKAEIETAETSFVRSVKAVAELRKQVDELSAKGRVIQTALHNVGSKSAEVKFEKEIRPLLESNCTSCHSSSNDKSGLVLESTDTLLQGGNMHGPAIIPKSSGKSPLMLYLRGELKHRKPLMGKSLVSKDIEKIANWIDQLPEEDPLVKLRRVEAATALAEKRLAAARAYLPALEARFAGDMAKYVKHVDPIELETLTQAAHKAEREANLLKAEENLLRAQQRLAEAGRAAKAGEDEVNTKRIEDARSQIEAAQKVLGQSLEGYTSVGAIYPDTNTGRRLALARWISSKENPLAARVAVNHIWLRHFGRALVPMVVNFGQNGTPPTNPALLDWLAVKFMESNWSMKTIHRLMVTSSTYRMQSFADPGNVSRSKDPENRYFWRMNPRRMEAEVVRDSMLHLAGKLDATVGGPEIQESKGEEFYRRSLYFQHTPDSQVLFLKLFDQPDPTECYQRTESVIPQQALAMSNGKLSLSMARLLARRISDQNRGEMDDREFVVTAFEMVLGRPPAVQERAASEKFLREQNELLSNPKKLTPVRRSSPGAIPPSADARMRAREDLVAALFNHNDFVTIR